MAFVTQGFVDTWRSKAHIGSRRPTQVVEIRGGSWRRDYRSWSDPLHAIIPGETKELPWYPIFTETTPWVTLPNVLACELTQDFEQNGLTVATLTLDNVAFEPTTGPFGDVYHAISRGYLSPSRGYDPPGRDASGLAQNSWYDVLTEQRNIRIWQGFGPPQRDLDDAILTSGGDNGAWMFNGLIDDVDIDADPARIIVTARAGKILTDSRVFGWNKSKQLLDPITFSDRLEADDFQDVGENAEASSQLSGAYPPSNVLDDDGSAKTYWYSAEHTTPTNTEWVEVHVPSGRYNSIVLECDAEMEAYIGFYVRALGDSDPPLYDGVSVAEEAFIAGDGTVPGANGGWGYITFIASTSAGRQVVDLGHSIVCGNNSVVRVGFRKLIDGETTDYRARVRTLKARRRQRSEIAIEQDWILVDDLSDIVRVTLRWAGFTSWEVEDAGVPLKGKFIVNRSSFLIDIIKRAVEVSGFVFFIKDPIDGDSMGVPVFRRNAALNSGPPIVEVRDTDMLTGLRMKRSEETLPYIIRVRGKTKRTPTVLSPSAEGLTSGVAILGGDSTRRIMAVYRPPWTQDNTLGGVIKHLTHTDNALRTLVECEVACYLIAIAGCLKAFTAVCETPAAPFIELDDQVGLLDTATGLNTRLWIASRSTHFQAGERVSWVSTVQGALIDNADLVALLAEMATVDFSPEVSPSQEPENTPLRFRP